MEDNEKKKSEPSPAGTEKRTIFTGWAHKQAANGTNWNRRFFVLTEDRVLSFFTDFQVLAPKLLGSIDIGNAAVSVLDASEAEEREASTGWRKNRPKWPRRLRAGANFAIDTPKRTYFLRCDSAELAQHFVAVLKDVKLLKDDIRNYVPLPPPLPMSYRRGQGEFQAPAQEGDALVGVFFHDVGDFVEGWMEAYTGRRAVLHELRHTNLKEIRGMLHDAFEVYEIKDEDVAEEEGRMSLFFTLIKDFFRELLKILYSLFRQRKDLFFSIARVAKFFGLVFSPGGFVILALKDIFEITFRGSQTKGEFQHMVSEFQQSHYMDAGKWFGLLCKRFTTVF